MSLCQDVLWLIETKRQSQEYENMMECWTECIIPFVFKVRRDCDEFDDGDPFIDEIGNLVTSNGEHMYMTSFLLTAIKRLCKRTAEEISHGQCLEAPLGYMESDYQEYKAKQSKK